MHRLPLKKDKKEKTKVRGFRGNGAATELYGGIWVWCPIKRLPRSSCE